MQLIVMETCPTPEGWTDSNYKTFRCSDDSESVSDSDSGSDSDTESEDTADNVNIRGYKKEVYKKILTEEELLPE